MDAKDVARERYPSGFAQLERYVGLLSTTGVEWGLIGPREVERVWGRHILNCAAPVDLEEGLVPEGSSVVDVGSGAGLPGVVWGIVRPDLRVTLLEPMQRRVDFLELVVGQLELGDRVQVVRGRAEDVFGDVVADVVTARAVAPLGRLAGWMLPLAKPGGRIVALKGRSALDEVKGSRTQLIKAGAGSIEIRTCGASWLEPPTTVVVLERNVTSGNEKRGGPGRGSDRRGR